MEVINRLMKDGDWMASETPLLTLLYDELPELDLQAGPEDMANLEPHTPLPMVSPIDPGRGGLLAYGARVAFGEHEVEVAALPAAMPEHVMERCVWPTPWPGSEKELMAGHRYQVVLYYTGQNADRVEQFLALYKTAKLLGNRPILGVVIEPAWMAHPGAIANKLLEGDMLKIVRASPPWLLWTGFHVVDWGEEVYYVSRGHHLFDLPELAIAAAELPDAQLVQQTFHDLLQYFYYGERTVIPGDVVALDESRFFELEHFEALQDAWQARFGIFRLRVVDAAEEAAQEALARELRQQQAARDAAEGTSTADEDDDN